MKYKTQNTKYRIQNSHRFGVIKKQKTKQQNLDDKTTKNKTTKS
jgi:hypothetical protein